MSSSARTSTPVNDHPVLTHEQVMSAIREGAGVARFRSLAAQADEAGAHELASELRARAALAGMSATMVDGLVQYQDAPSVGWDGQYVNRPTYRTMTALISRGLVVGGQIGRAHV